ncbi:transposase [Bacteroides pyogenes]|nr:transposase [Bacteroides pyogenes]
MKADTICEVLRRIDREKRQMAKEITLDMSNYAGYCPGAFSLGASHHRPLSYACDALQEMRIAHRREAIQADTDVREEAKLSGLRYIAKILPNGDTSKQLIARSRYLHFKSVDKWTPSQKWRAELLFEQYPELKKAYSLTHSLRMIFSKNSHKDVARMSLARRHEQVDQAASRALM